MAYIGRDTDKISNVEVLDNITFDGSSSYTLQKGGSNFTPSSANTLLLSIDGVVQAGNFTVSGLAQPTDEQLASYETAANTAEANAQVDATRISQYGSWGDQLDEIYHDIDAWKTRIQSVKDNNPKS